jgi:hypothetical protein
VATVQNRELVGKWVKFNVVIQERIKNSMDSLSLRSKNTSVWLTMNSLACKCPSIRVGR